MHILNTAVVFANEGAATEGNQVSPYVFGVFTFGALVLLLIITMMIKVGD